MGRIRTIKRTAEGNLARSKARMRRLDALVAEMYAYYQSGRTLHEVGQKYGRDGTGIYSLFKIRGLPRRRRQLPEQIARRAALHRARLDPLVERMYADYQRPMSLAAVGRKYKVDRRSVRECFERRGLAIRPSPYKPPRRGVNGEWLRTKPFTDRQLRALISRTETLHVPAELKHEWRSWPLARRAWFIAELRKKLGRPGDRPRTPFSINVEPFDYTTPRAHELAARLNAGTSSRTARVKVDVCSQGVIWDGRLWFWSKGSVGYQHGPWSEKYGRPTLHKVIWERANGRPVPRGHVVRFADGNKNNLAPDNLRLATRNDVARENQAAGMRAKSRALTALLLNRSTRKETPDDKIRHLRSSRR